MRSLNLFKKVLIIFCVTFIVLTGFSYWLLRQDMPEENTGEKNIISLNGKKLSVDIADDVFEQSQGLSGREKLAYNEGMLFVFPSPSLPSFWMKDMNFAIDIIWLDENASVVGIEFNMTPESFPRTFPPPSPVKYVLEVNSGWTRENNIKVGSKMTFQ